MQRPLPGVRGIAHEKRGSEWERSGGEMKKTVFCDLEEVDVHSAWEMGLSLW